MYATVRRYEGIDKGRADEVTKKVGEKLVPRMSKLPGFDGYFLIEAGEGVMTSISLFETADQAHESTRVAATWIREEKPRDGASEHAEDHSRRSRLARDERSVQGVTASSSSVPREGPLRRAFSASSAHAARCGTSLAGGLDWFKVAGMAERLRVWLVGGHECDLDLGEGSALALMEKIENAGDRNWFSSDDGRSRVRGSAIVRIEIEGHADTPHDPVA